jgi:2-keto-3-deoxy-L-fuconate dehydrogenase
LQDLDDRVLIITGAAMGIGEAVARMCAGLGAWVVLIDRDARVSDVAYEIGQAAQAFVGDVTDPHTIERAIRAALDLRGRIDALANVAGEVVNGTAVTTELADWERSLATNLTGPMLWAKAVLQSMVAAGKGSIVNITSVVGVLARPDGVAYVAAKAGLLGLTRSIALDFGPLGIRCNAVSPGTIETPMLRGYFEHNPSGRDAMIERSWVGRLGTPDDVARVCVPLLADHDGFVNGAEFVVDGGMTASLV